MSLPTFARSRHDAAMPVWIWWTVLGCNVVAFALFGLDKWRASRGGRRVPERTLLGWTFACGCVGAFLGAQLFRHKTKKASYRWRALLLTVVNPLWYLVYREFAG